MAIYSCNYPINLTLGKGTSLLYTLKCNGETFFEGRIILPVADTIITDVQSIVRHKLLPDYLPAIQNTGSGNIYGEGDNYSIMEVEWEATAEDSITTVYSGSFIVVYDYNTEYEYPLPDSKWLNDPISLRLAYNQPFFICYYHTDDDFVEFEVYDYEDERDRDFSCGDPATNYIREHDYVCDRKRSFKMTGDATIRVYDYIEGCYQYAIYYINKFGGLDTLLLGKCVESWSASRTGATLYNNRTDAQSFENIPLRQQIIRQLACNTILLTNEEAEKIDHLIFTPRAWIYDFEKESFASVIIDTSSMTRKYSKYDKAVYYSFTVKYSQYQWR